MSDQDRREEEAVRRILLALTSGEDRIALEAAAALAEHLSARIEGLFHQDPDLTRLAGLPFAREIALSTAESRPLAASQLEREQRAQAATVEQLLRRRAGRGVQWSFTVVRERYPALPPSGESGPDLYVLGRPPSRHGLPHTAQTGPVLVLYDGSESARRALPPAATLAARSHLELVVLIPAAGAEEWQRAREEAVAALAGSDGTARYLSLPADATGQLDRTARGHRASLLVVGQGSLPHDPPALHGLLERMPCPVVVAR